MDKFAAYTALSEWARYCAGPHASYVVWDLKSYDWEKIANDVARDRVTLEEVKKIFDKACQVGYLKEARKQNMLKQIKRFV